MCIYVYIYNAYRWEVNRKPLASIPSNHVSLTLLSVKSVYHIGPLYWIVIWSQTRCHDGQTIPAFIPCQTGCMAVYRFAFVRRSLVRQCLCVGPGKAIIMQLKNRPCHSTCAQMYVLCTSQVAFYAAHWAAECMFAHNRPTAERELSWTTSFFSDYMT